jgi:predicted phage-related endonuclease
MVSTVITETKVSTVKKVTDKVDLTNQAAATEKALAAFTFAKDAIKAYEEKKAEAEATLRELLGDADVAIIGGVERFKLAHSTNSKIDRKVLQELFPEAFEATLVKTPYTFIKTI